MLHNATKEMLRNINKEMIRVNNKKQILNLIQKNKVVTQAYLKKELNISITTIISNINELINEGMVEISGMGDSTGGRKPVQVAFRKDAHYSIGVDLMVQGTRIIVANLDSEIVADSTIPPNRKQPAEYFQSIANEIDRMLKAKGIPREKVLGVGFSIPATVNEEKMLLEEAVNLNLSNIDFKEYEKTIGFPLYIENEANIAAYAEMKLGIAKDTSNILYVSITDKGVGTGIIINGRLYKGKNKRAGECGHIKIVMNGDKCCCGMRGCWNAYVSEDVLLEQYETVSGKKVTLDGFMDELRQEEPNAVQIWDRYLDYFTAGLESLIFSFDPNYVIIGGRIAHYEEFLIEPLKSKVFRADNVFFKRDDVKIRVSKLMENSSVLGASLLPLVKLFSLNEKLLCL